jgi:hypothetical protein
LVASLLPSTEIECHYTALILMIKTLPVICWMWKARFLMTYSFSAHEIHRESDFLLWLVNKHLTIQCLHYFMWSHSDSVTSLFLQNIKVNYLLK